MLDEKVYVPPYSWMVHDIQQEFLFVLIHQTTGQMYILPQSILSSDPEKAALFFVCLHLWKQ